MNKEKIMQILNSIDLGLNIIEEGQQLDKQALTESVRTDVEDLKEEVNSKPIMPKVFDDCYKDITAESSDIQGIVTYFKFTIDGKYNNFGPEKALFNWVHSGEYSKVLGMNLIDKNRYKKCLEAILYGYEVEE